MTAPRHDRRRAERDAHRNRMRVLSMLRAEHGRLAFLYDVETDVVVRIFADPVNLAIADVWPDLDEDTLMAVSNGVARPVDVLDWCRRSPLPEQPALIQCGCEHIAEGLAEALGMLDNELRAAFRAIPDGWFIWSMTPQLEAAST